MTSRLASPIRSLPIYAAFAGTVIASVPQAFAGGMALTMQNGAHLAHAYAAGASAEDASTVYYNPAGLVLLDRPQFVAAAAHVDLRGRFADGGSTTAGAFPTGGGAGGDVGLARVVPSIYLAVPLRDSWTFGLGVSAPFGLATEYDEGWVGRYHALRSELETINVNPAVAWRASERLSLGAGYNWRRAEATLSNAIDFGLIGFLQGVPGLVPGAADGAVRIQGSDTAGGFNVGALYEVADGARIGVHYRSKTSHRLEGRADFTGVPAPFAPLFADQDAVAPLVLPEIVSVSWFQHLTPSFALMADWSTWKWSRFAELSVDFADPLTPNSSQRHDWRDASIYSLGLRWQSSSRFTWRTGIAYNETPVPDAARRTARIPDSDRVWLGLGLAWNVSSSARLDLGWAHLFMKDSTVANDDGLGHLLLGDYSLEVDIVSAQFSWGF
jgi:long-chain fatty acid transport protein